MLSNPPSTGDKDLDNFLKSVKRHIDDALRPADGWRLSDFSADVSEVISDKRDLIDIVTRYDDINALKDSVDLILADYAEVIADSKAIGKQYEDHAEVFSHTMEWWNQNRKIIEDAAAAMAATLQASDYADAAEASATRAGNHEDGASQAKDDAVTAKNEAQETATQVATQVEAAATHAGNAQTSATNAALSEQVAEENKEAAESAAASASAAAGQADASAGAASDAADRAEGVVDTVQWQGDQLSVMGKVSPPLTGDDGATPYIGPNGTWWVGDTDTGVQAQGEKGDPGDGNGDVLWSELTPVLAEKADSDHSHTPSSIGAAPADHTHSEYATTQQMQEALDGKSGVGHRHSWDQVDDKPSTYPPESHDHTIVQVSGLQDALDGKVDIGHKHVSADITDAVPGSSVASSYSNRLVRLGESGRLSVPLTPSASDQPTSKQYVDAQVATRATKAYVDGRTPEIRTVSSPEMATSPGVLYVVMEG